MDHSSDAPKKDLRLQHARFIETVRKLGCDEDPSAFDEKLKVIARHKPKEVDPPPGTKKAKPSDR